MYGCYLHSDLRMKSIQNEAGTYRLGETNIKKEFLCRLEKRLGTTVNEEIGNVVEEEGIQAMILLAVTSVRNRKTTEIFSLQFGI
mmetsp:Transcript_44717/g.65756  ORF Transcript_44717/g.65756 Transcript_44717/m.65756 type:complete len:85 (-) Transcript_44717:165-419(-)